jgi:hypothetical protein
MKHALSELIDTDQYPIFDKDSVGYAALTARCQEALRATGLCVLEGFVRPAALEQMRAEGRAALPKTFYSSIVGNAYLKDQDPKLPADHAYNLTDETSLGGVAYDQIDPQEVIRRIYDSSDVLKFLGDALGREVHYYECPLGKINYSMMRDGDYLRWHFDQSDFVVSIPVQDCESGGKYEYVYNLRSAADENYDEVGKVLRGDRSRVQVLNTPAGSLVLFEGRYTIHRVTHIRGSQTRIMALLGYADKPGVTSNEYLRRIRYGRTS